MTKILVADNKAKWLSDMCEIIDSRGYAVITATSPTEAMAVMGRHDADIAVIDLRLKDDTSDYDISGLNVARDSDRMVPKIIVSGFGSEREITNALKIDIDAYPAIVDFVQKGDIASKLVPAIERALRVKETWTATAQTKISNQLNEDYKSARREARIHYWVSLGVSVGFAGIIFVGAFLLHTNKGTDEWSSLPLLFTVMGVLVAEITNYLFGRKLGFLSQRVERFHEELLQTERFGQLLGMSYSIKDEKAREEFKIALFNAATAEWLRRGRSLSDYAHVPESAALSEVQERNSGAK